MVIHKTNVLGNMEGGDMGGGNMGGWKEIKGTMGGGNADGSNMGGSGTLSCTLIIPVNSFKIS